MFLLQIVKMLQLLKYVGILKFTIMTMTRTKSLLSLRVVNVNEYSKLEHTYTIIYVSQPTINDNLHKRLK